MKKLNDFPQNKHPREKMLNSGSKSLSETKLLAIITEKGTKNKDVLPYLIKSPIRLMKLDIEAKDILQTG